MARLMENSLPATYWYIGCVVKPHDAPITKVTGIVAINEEDYTIYVASGIKGVNNTYRPFQVKPVLRPMSDATKSALNLIAKDNFSAACREYTLLRLSGVDVPLPEELSGRSDTMQGLLGLFELSDGHYREFAVNINDL